jgi:membrane associated rhomboid family serine protease/Tfp pilus assembly protein PilF
MAANCIRCGRKMPAFSFKKICPWCVQHEAAQRSGDSEDAKQVVIPAPWVAQRSESSISLTQILFGMNVAVFLGMAFGASSLMEFPGQELVQWGANAGPLTLSGQWWRLLTYMFLHGDLIHIAFNMWCLWDLGALSESLYGRWTFAAIYLITGVGGGVASVGWNPRVLSVGASGAIFGLAGALIASFYLGEFSLPKIAIKGVLRSLLIFAGFNLFLGGVFQGVDNGCHVGGFVSGLILGALIARLAPDQNNLVRRAGVVLVVALMVTGSALGVQRWRGSPVEFGQGLGRANQLLYENRPEDAIAELQRVLKREPNFVPAHFTLAQAYISKRDFPLAEAELKRVLELQPQSQAALYELGMVYLDEDRAKDAKDTFTQMLAQNPNNTDAHLGLGMTLAAEENYLGAIEEYKKVIQLGRTTVGAYYFMGNSYVKLKQYDDAISVYLKERENGDDADLENALADAYQAKGMMQQAKDARDKAEQLKGEK